MAEDFELINISEYDPEHNAFDKRLKLFIMSWQNRDDIKSFKAYISTLIDKSKEIDTKTLLDIKHELDDIKKLISKGNKDILSEIATKKKIKKIIEEENNKVKKILIYIIYLAFSALIRFIRIICDKSISKDISDKFLSDFNTYTDEITRIYTDLDEKEKIKQPVISV